MHNNNVDPMQEMAYVVSSLSPLLLKVRCQSKFDFVKHIHYIDFINS